MPLPMTVPDPLPAVRRPPARRSDPLADLRRLRRRQAELDEQLRDALHQAVLVGHTYAEVGDALGVSRQAARQRHQRGEA